MVCSARDSDASSRQKMANFLAPRLCIHKSGLSHANSHVKRRCEDEFVRSSAENNRVRVTLSAAIGFSSTEIENIYIVTMKYPEQTATNSWYLVKRKNLGEPRLVKANCRNS